MNELREVAIPDLGDAEKVQVVDILVSVGDKIRVDGALITLESDKASMDVPAPVAGTVREIHLEIGSEVKEGDLIVTLELGESGGQDARAELVEDGAEAVDTPETSAVEEATTTHAPSRRAGASNGSALRAEIVVLGGGPGGYTAAFRAADLGKKVALVERQPALGGVCLNVGCIPSKALLHVARVIEEAADLESFGVDFGKPKIDLDRMRNFKDGVVGRLTKGLSALAKQRQVEVIRGTGRFTGSSSLVVESAGGETGIAFEQAVIAVGSRVSEVPGLRVDDPRVMDSTSALELQGIPRRLLLIGGGIIGLEMATVFGALGSRLTVIEMLEGLIPGCDRDLVKPLERRLKRRYKAEIHLRTKVADLKPLKRGVKATFEGDGAPAPQLFDRVLVAVGRRPNGDRIAAEAAGVHVDVHGFVPVDEQQRTNVPHIFAVGDVTGMPMLAHKATHQGKVAAEVACGEKSGFDARVIPSVAYTDPEIAWVGVSETEAEEKEIVYEKATFPWSASGRSLGMGRSDGSTKILFDPETNRVIGAGIVGPNAGDLISELTLAIEMDCEATDLALTIHPHPTLSETVALASEAFAGTITDLYTPKRR